MGCGHSVESAIQEESSSALMGMWETLSELLRSPAESVQGVEVPLAYTVSEFARIAMAAGKDVLACFCEG